MPISTVTVLLIKVRCFDPDDDAGGRLLHRAFATIGEDMMGGPNAGCKD